MQITPTPNVPPTESPPNVSGTGSASNVSGTGSTPNVRETRKRKREVVLAVLAAVLFVICSYIAFRLTENSQKLPFVYSIFYFGLLNFNIVLLLFLLFLIFRNVVKVFTERQTGIAGGTLKGKLVAAFVTFSVVPTALMFLVSVFYINSSFDKWFSVKVRGVLRDSLEVNNTFYVNAKKRNYHFAQEIAASLKGHKTADLKSIIIHLRDHYSLDVVELYPDLFQDRIVATAVDENLPDIPAVSLDLLQKGIKEGVEVSTRHQFNEGNLVRVIVPVTLANNRHAAVVVSSFMPISLINTMDEIAATYNDFQDLNPLEYPLKTIYLVILILMTLVIIFGATWFGFHLARHLSTPLERLAAATKQLALGQYPTVDVSTGSTEINQLVGSFNQMTQDLKSTLDKLDEHSRYIEVVLSQVSAGVISADAKGTITTVNRRAGRLLKIETTKLIGQNYKTVIPDSYLVILSGILAQLKQHRVNSIQKEIRVDVGGQSMVMQMTISLLRDEHQHDLGIVLVFDDLTMLVNAQRASAWREVARRIAHEIKNPLTPIKLSAQRLEKKFGQQIADAAFLTCTSTIIKQVDELRDLVNEFSNFARLPQSQFVPGDLNKTVEEAIYLYQTAHREFKMSFVPDPGLPQFDFDPEQMKRAVANLVSNAVQAFQEASLETGEIEISMKFDRSLSIVRLVIKDNGPGIPDDLRSRIFEPYFSTKRSGTGLGLAIVKRIVDDHNGFIRAFANETGGTKFVIELPLLRVQSHASGHDSDGAIDIAAVSEPATSELAPSEAAPNAPNSGKRLL